jgi:membrane protein
MYPMRSRISEKIKFFWVLLKNTVQEFSSDNAIKLSAALSYYTIFSLPPLLLIIISLCGIFFGDDAVKGHIFLHIRHLVGNQAALQVQEMLKNVKLSDENTFATVAGIIILLAGASGVFGEIQSSINYIWGIEAKPKRGLLKYLQNRLMSFSMIGTVSFLLLVSLIINSLMDILSKHLMNYFPQAIIYVFYLINLLFMLIIITLLFIVIFRTLPDGKIKFNDCLAGASFTAVLFIMGKFAISLYLNTASVASGYGAAGSVIIILVWVYYSAIILYFGAEFTKMYALVHGHSIVPNRYSIQIKKTKAEVPAGGEIRG